MSYFIVYFFFCLTFTEPPQFNLFPPVAVNDYCKYQEKNLPLVTTDPFYYLLCTTNGCSLKKCGDNQIYFPKENRCLDPRTKNVGWRK